jgi:N,N'-diacetylchitobiose transport system permease protein
MSTKSQSGQRHGSTGRTTSKVILSIVSVIIFLVSAFPVYWMLNSSFLPTNKIRSAVPTFFPGPGDFTLKNYQSAIFENHRADFLPALGNSLAVTFFALVLSLIIAFLASIAVGRYRFKGRKVFIVSILVIQMIPGEAMMLTYFRIMDGAHLTENIIGLGLIYLATVLPFTIWTLRGFVTSVPAELEEAAMVDGCSRGRAFWKITFPLLAPGLVSTGVFAFIQAWNEFTMALIIMTKPENMTLPVWLRTFQQATHATDWGGLMAGSVCVSIPVVIFFMIVQGRMTGGLVSGAVKG